MMSKSVSRKPSPSARIKQLQKQFREQREKLFNIEVEHDKNMLDGGEEGAIAWIESFSISNLRDLYEAENNLPRTNYSMKNLDRKYKLRKQYAIEEERLDILRCKLREAKIEAALNNIKIKLKKDVDFTP